jgi:hypothetical protein
MATASPASRQVSFAVLDTSNEPLAGATLEFFVDGVAYGAATTGGQGATISVPLYTGEIEVVARYGESRRTVKVGVDQHSYAFTFQRLLFKFFEPSGARCPDGTTGQPCVDCVIDGKPIRICATA